MWVVLAMSHLLIFCFEYTVAVLQRLVPASPILASSSILNLFTFLPHCFTSKDHMINRRNGSLTWFPGYDSRRSIDPIGFDLLRHSTLPTRGFDRLFTILLRFTQVVNVRKFSSLLLDVEYSAIKER